MSQVRFACVTHEGNTHASNEDRWLADPARGLYLVADGMANETAPELVIQRLPEMMAGLGTEVAELADPALHEQIAVTLEYLNKVVRQQMHQRGEAGLGATLVMVLVRDRQALIVSLGDSRAYLHRGGALRQVTRDHSYVQELLDRGVLTPEEAEASRANGGPTRFLGMAGPAAADLQTLDLIPGDRLLLCSDGLTAMLTDRDIAEHISSLASPQEICQQLVDAANISGGIDNITALLLEAGEGS